VKRIFFLLKSFCHCSPGFDFACASCIIQIVEESSSNQTICYLESRAYFLFRNFTEPVVTSNEVNVADRAPGILCRTRLYVPCPSLVGTPASWLEGFPWFLSIPPDQCSGGATPASSKSFSIYHLPAVTLPFDTMFWEVNSIVRSH